MFPSRLRPDTATMVGVFTSIGVVLIFQHAVPNLTDVRVSAPHNDDVERERKMAAWKSAGLIAAVFLVSRDLNSYLISGATLVAMDYHVKHSNAINPGTGTLDVPDGTQTLGGDRYAPTPASDGSDPDSVDYGYAV